MKFRVRQLVHPELLKSLISNKLYSTIISHLGNLSASVSHDEVMDFGWEDGKPVRLCEDYQAKSKTMSRGMPAALTLAMSAARASVIDACSAEYFCANSKSPVA